MRTTSEELIEFIAYHFGSEFLSRLDDEIVAGYSRANAESMNYSMPGSQLRMRGYSRHYHVKEALDRAASALSGFISNEHRTKRSGEYYVAVQRNDIKITHVCLKNNRPPREAQFRSNFAKLNEFLDPVEPDLFDRTVEDEDELGNLFVVICVSPVKGNDVIPEIYICVPWSDMKGWHLFCPIDVVQKACETTDSGVIEPFPKLKRRLTDIERDLRDGTEGE